jgi:diguanylate cyclase (GGDEF)-like protein
MLRGLLRILTFILLSINALNAQSNDNVRQILDSNSTPFEYFPIDNRTYSIESIRQLTPEQWVPARDFSAYGLINRHYWLHMRVNIQYTKLEPLFLEIANPLVDKLDIYLFRGDQSRYYTAGDSVHTNKRPIETPVLYFPLPDNSLRTLDIYIKYRDDSASYLPLAITNSKESFERVNAHGIFTGIVSGVILMLLVMTLTLYRHEKSKLLAYFFVFLMAGSIVILVLEGLASIYLWHSMPWLQNLIFPPLLLLTLWCAIELSRLLIAQHIVNFPNIEKTLLWLSRSVILISPILFALPSFISIIVSVVALCIALLIMVGVLGLFTIKSKIFLPWLLASWAAFVGTLAIKSIYFSGLISLPSSVMTLTTLFYCVQFMLWGRIIIKHYINDKEIALSNKIQQLLESEIKNTEADIKLTEKHQEHLNLEALVNDRTFELNVTLRELQETNRQLEVQATNDALTGVKNRKFFDQRLLAEYRLSRRQHTPISLLLLDADKFKNVNDTYGHLAGDKVLIAISKIASLVLKRPNDYVCRYGGEEFAILLSNTDETGALKVAEIIRQKIAEATITTDSHDLKVSVSIGVSSLMINSETADEQLFDQADKALYYAKGSGRNNVKTYHELELSTN